MNRLIIACLIGVIVFLAALLWVQLDRNMVVLVPDPQRMTTAADVGAELVAIRQQATIARDQIDMLKQLATLLIGLSSLYAVALGITSYLNLQNVLEQAKQKKGEIDTLGSKVENIQKDLEKTAPAIVAAQRSIDSVTVRLQQLLPSTDVEREEFYDVHLGEEQRQEIIAMEPLATIFGRHALGPLEAARMLHGLGRFYNARHARLKRREDLERAYYYLLTSVALNDQDFSAHNDLGNVLDKLAAGDPKRRALLRTRARDHYEQSLSLSKVQQRALFNLANHAADDHDFQQASDQLGEALKRDKWQTDFFASRRRDILYNRACFQSLLGKARGDDSLATAALRDLQEACLDMSASLATTLLDDTDLSDPQTANEKDLGWLATVRKREIDDLRSRATAVKAGAVG